MMLGKHEAEFWDKILSESENFSFCDHKGCAVTISRAYAEAVRKDEEEKRKLFRAIGDAVYEELFRQALFLEMSVPCEWYMSCRGGQFCLASSEIKWCKRDNCPKVKRDE